MEDFGDYELQGQAGSCISGCHPQSMMLLRGFLKGGYNMYSDDGAGVVARRGLQWHPWDPSPRANDHDEACRMG